MLKILVTYAVQGEFAEIEIPDAQVYYLRTGIGKVKSAYHLTYAIHQIKPDLVINMGTVGTLNHQVGDILVCRRFVDRDMLSLTSLGLESHIDCNELLSRQELCSHFKGNYVCNTGDSFLTEITHVEGDVVDMEAYSQAFVCREEKIPFIAVKYVTDVIGQNSVQVWEDKLADARIALGNYFKVLSEQM